MALDFQTKIRNGFQSSAYRGASGELEAPPTDDVTTKQGLRFAEMISNKLEPFPTVKTAPGLGEKFATTKINNKTRTFVDISSISTVPQPATTSRVGVVSGGLNDSRGFLETTTTQQRFKGQFDDDVMRVFTEGKLKEASLDKERQMLHDAAFESAEPNGWRKSTFEHSNFSNVDVASYREQYKSRKNLVTIGGQQNREVSQGNLVAGNTVDKDALAEHLREVREKTLPRGYSPKVANWQTSTQAFFPAPDLNAVAAANSKGATTPVQCATNILSDVEAALFAEKESSARRRHANGFETESSTAFQDRSSEGDVEKKFRASGALNLVNGTFLMSHRYHHPRNIDTGDKYSPSQVVQGQYVPMSTVSVPAKN